MEFQLDTTVCALFFKFVTVCVFDLYYFKNDLLPIFTKYSIIFRNLG